MQDTNGGMTRSQYALQTCWVPVYSLSLQPSQMPNTTR